MCFLLGHKFTFCMVTQHDIFRDIFALSLFYAIHPHAMINMVINQYHGFHCIQSPQYNQCHVRNSYLYRFTLV